MTVQEKQTHISIQLAQGAINLLTAQLAQALVDNEELTAKLAIKEALLKGAADFANAAEVDLKSAIARVAELTPKPAEKSVG